MQPLDYLVIAPHPDDAELAMGGSILSLQAQGATVGVLDLTDGEPTPHGSPEIRRRETEAATAVLGLTWRGNLGLTNRRLEVDLDSRAKLAGVIRQLKPRVLFAPYWEDAHPDHVAASALVDAARFWAKLTKTDLPGEPHYPQRILYYFSVHLRLHHRASFVLDVTDHFETKMQALSCYRSQFVEGRPTEPPTLLDDLRDRARYWGWAIGVRYGEPFVTPRGGGVARSARFDLTVRAPRSWRRTGFRFLLSCLIGPGRYSSAAGSAWPGRGSHSCLPGALADRNGCPTEEGRPCVKSSTSGPIKGDERYVYVYDDASREALVEAFRDQAADPALSLNWFDAAVLTQKAREQAEAETRARDGAAAVLTSRET